MAWLCWHRWSKWSLEGVVSRKGIKMCEVLTRDCEKCGMKQSCRVYF